MILSILIPSMFKRAGVLSTMLRNLDHQITSCGAEDKVEVLCKVDNGENSTGKKRNELVMDAKGEWVSFADDDDYLYDGYVSEILKALESNPDVIGLNGFITTNGANMKRWFISKDLNYCAMVDASGLECYHRFNNHLSPVRRSIALQIKYPDVYIGEDYAYACALKESGLIKTEVVIDKPLYLYKFISNK